VGARERGPEGRTIVAVFDGEDQARSWIVECIDRGAQLFADGAPAWDEISATHSVLTVNHDERYADGIINNNAMERFFSRLRRFEATHHHISGISLHRYATDAPRARTTARSTTGAARRWSCAPQRRHRSRARSRDTGSVEAQTTATTSLAMCSRRSLELYPAKMTTFDSGRNYIRHERGRRASINECQSLCLADLSGSLRYVV
jgi:hypothetical protein